MYANASDQRHLLDLADVDGQIRQARNRAAHLPEHEALATLSARHKELRAAHEAAGAQLAEVETRLAERVKRAEELRAQIVSGTAKLNAGEGLTSRDLVALQHELETLGGLLDAAESAELESMEEQEAASAAHEGLAREAADVAAEGKQTLAARDAALAEINATIASLEGTRTGLADALEATNARLLAAFNDAFEAGALGAAEVRGATCPSCGQTFGSVELTALRSADAETVLPCEECETLLVPRYSSSIGDPRQ